MKMKESAQYHKEEAIRIKILLDGLGLQFSEDGIVKTVLRHRIEQEEKRGGTMGGQKDLEEQIRNLGALPLTPDFFQIK
jgi:hypothetical protein